MKQSSILERTVGANTGAETHAAATNSVRKTRLMTAEAVRAGHPDKFCDQLADRLLDGRLSSRDELVAYADGEKIKIRTDRLADRKKEYALP